MYKYIVQYYESPLYPITFCAFQRLSSSKFDLARTNNTSESFQYAMFRMSPASCECRLRLVIISQRRFRETQDVAKVHQPLYHTNRGIEHRLDKYYRTWTRYHSNNTINGSSTDLKLFPRDSKTPTSGQTCEATGLWTLTNDAERSNVVKGVPHET